MGTHIGATPAIWATNGGNCSTTYNSSTAQLHSRAHARQPTLLLDLGLCSGHSAALRKTRTWQETAAVEKRHTEVNTARYLLIRNAYHRNEAYM